MALNSLNAISPLDGRYYDQISDLSFYFSEEALMKYRLQVEVEYFIALWEIPLPPLENKTRPNFEKLRDIYRNFTAADAIKIKEIEKVTNHDVKALEYFLKDKISETPAKEFKEFIHFGLTSQDINNTAFPIAFKGAVKDVYLPLLQKVIDFLKSCSLMI